VSRVFLSNTYILRVEIIAITGMRPRRRRAELSATFHRPALLRHHLLGPPHRAVTALIML
jgi:hypothetical protein